MELTACNIIERNVKFVDSFIYDLLKEPVHESNKETYILSFLERLFIKERIDEFIREDYTMKDGTSIKVKYIYLISVIYDRWINDVETDGYECISLFAKDLLQNRYLMKGDHVHG